MTSTLSNFQYLRRLIQTNYWNRKGLILPIPLKSFVREFKRVNGHLLLTTRETIRAPELFIENRISLVEECSLIEHHEIVAQSKKQLYSFTLLQYALTSHRSNIADFLIDEGCTTDDLGVHQFTPFIFACNNNYPEIARKIVERNCSSLHKTCIDNRTALFYAARARMFDIVETLLERGVRDLPCNSGFTVEHLARMQNIPEIVDLFESHRQRHRQQHNNSSISSVVPSLNNETEKETKIHYNFDLTPLEKSFLFRCIEDLQDLQDFQDPKDLGEEEKEKEK